MRFLILLAFLAAWPVAGSAQDWREELAADLVTIADGKMQYDEVGLLTLALPGYEKFRVQVRVHAEVASNGFMSRDNFVGITTTTFMTLLMASYAQSYQVSAVDFLNGFDFDDLDDPIGNPDLELNLFMTDGGMQIEIVDTTTGKVTRNTMTWDEVYSQ